MSKINEPEYLTIKQLLAKGYEGGKVAEIVGRGRGVVSRINTSTSYEEFIKRGKATRAKYKNKYKAGAKPKTQQQLPLDTPKKTEHDLMQSMVDKIVALRDDIELYMATPACDTRERQRDAKMALVKLEEASMWLTCHW